ncbi:MAG: glycosyltransferase family 4 protein [Pseudomonadota bacterium]
MAPRPVLACLPSASEAADFRMPRVLWRGFGSLGESLGNVTFETLWALEEMGLSGQVRFAPMRPGVAWFPEERFEPRAALLARLAAQYPEPLELEVQIPSVVAPVVRPCVRFFFHEFGYLPEGGAGGPAPDDVIWAPSSVVADALAAQFPEHRLIRVPHGVNPRVFNPEVEPTLGLDDPRFKFLYVGTTISRKGIDILTEAFLAEFAPSENAWLVIKAFPTTAGFVWRELRNHPRIILLDDIFYPPQVAGLMRACQVVVAPYRAEGFCLPVLEAMACGLPAIVPAGGATDDFCPDECCWRIDTHEVRVAEADEPGLPGLRFLEPDGASLRRLMRLAHESREEVRRKGKAAAGYAGRFSWRAVTGHLFRQLSGRH